MGGNWIKVKWTGTCSSGGRQAGELRIWGRVKPRGSGLGPSNHQHNHDGTSYAWYIDIRQMIAISDSDYWQFDWLTDDDDIVDTQFPPNGPRPRLHTRQNDVDRCRLLSLSLMSMSLLIWYYTDDCWMSNLGLWTGLGLPGWFFMMWLDNLSFRA